METVPKNIAKNLAETYGNYRAALAVYLLSPNERNQRALQKAALNFEIWADVTGINLVDHDTLRRDIAGKTLVPLNELFKEEETKT